jgi:hypothetical protein
MHIRVLTMMVLALALLVAGEVIAQTHPSQLPPLTPDATFPRMSPRMIAVSGFPDHKHAHNWRSWDVLEDENGVTYGPGSLCDHRALIRREGLVTDPDQKAYGQFVLRHNPEYGNCDMIQFIEQLDWANHEVPALLGLATTDTLVIFNPDNAQHYTELTGQGIWRLYALDGDTCTMQPFPVLMARTLDTHGAFMVVTDWILQENIEQDLPPWLHQGIVEYVGEDGVHLTSYMREFRNAGPVLLSPAEIDAKLTGGVDPDDGMDRVMFRRACYGSFLMVWQLVENEGGLEALREFLDLAATGVDLDQASTQVYGMNLGQLSDYLDPVRNGDPISKDLAPAKAHIEPQK